MDVSCSKQIPIPFKLYAGTECLLKGTYIKGGKNKTLYQKHIPNLQEQNWFALITDLLYKLKFLQANAVLINLKNGFLDNKNKLMKQLLIIFKKLKMTTENEKNYQESQDCWFSMKNQIQTK